MTSYPAQVTGKRLELLKESFPKISKVAVLGDPTIKLHELNWQELKAVGRFLAVRLQSLEVRSPNPDSKESRSIASPKTGGVLNSRWRKPPISQSHRLNL
jgi:hypothetical protein